MPAALGQLVVSLSANIAEFTGAMSRAAYISNKRMLEIQEVAKKAGAVIGASMVAGAGAFALAMKSVIDNADEVGKAAQKLGMTTEALSGLQYAADLSGVSAESLKTGVLRLSKAASEGNKAFAAMGIEVRKQDGTLKDTEILVKEVADKFSGYKDSTEKAAIAQELFGRSGADLIPLLNSGASGIASMQEEAAQLGIVLSGDVTKGAEAVNDNVSRMQTAARGIVTQVAVNMLPTFEKFSEKLVNVAKDSDALKTAAEGLSGSFKLLVSGGAIAMGVFGAVGKSIASVAAALVAASRGDFQQAWVILGEGGQDTVSSVRSSLDTVTSLWADAERKVKASATGTQGKGTAPTIVDSDALERAAREAAKREKRLQDESVKGWVAYADAVFAEADQLNNDLAKISEEYWKKEDENRAKSMQGWFDWIDQEQEAAIKEGEELLAISEQNAKKAADAAAEFGFTMSSAFEDAVIEGKKFRDVLAGVAQDIARMILRKSVTTPIANAVSGMFSNFNPFGLFGGGRASGGSVKAGSSYLVGEFGPEVVTMGGNGHVTPNGKLGGDTNVSIVVNSDGSSRSESGDGRNMELARRLEAAVRGVLVAEKRPGGLLAE